MSDVIYILGDADHVREKIEYHLLRGDLMRVTKLSAALASGLGHLVRDAGDALNAETIMAGGDDVLLRIPAGAYSATVLEKLSENFLAETGCTISFGVGSEITLAYLNLRRAKANGGGSIVLSDQEAP